MGVQSSLIRYSFSMPFANVQIEEVNQIESENVCAEASTDNSNDSTSGSWSSVGCKSRLLCLRNCIRLVKRILRLPIDYFWWCVEYCGFAAETTKITSVLICGLIIAEPGIYLLIAGLTTHITPLWLKYLLYAGIWLHFIVPSAALAWRDYRP